MKITKQKSTLLKTLLLVFWTLLYKFCVKTQILLQKSKMHIHCMHTFVADPQCVSTANSSSQWLKENFGFFSRFASVLDFYKLNRNFSGVNENQPLDFNTLTPTPISPVLLLRWPPTSSPFVSSAAGGSSSPDSQTAGGDAAAASSDPAGETRRHRLGDGLPAGIPQGWEADASPASPGRAGGGGNDIVTTKLSFFNVTLGHHLLQSNCRSVPRAASTNKCEFWLSHIVSHKPQDFTADVMICHWKKHGRMHLTRQYALVKYHWQSL